MDSSTYLKHVKQALEDAIDAGQQSQGGQVAAYIPELAEVDPNFIAGSIILSDGAAFTVESHIGHKFTLQSVSKLVLLIGMLEEFGPDRVFSWVGSEPSGQPFSSISALEQTGPIPSNPLINAGAIALADKIPGEVNEKMSWLRTWLDRLFQEKLTFNETVFHSEMTCGDTNRALAYFMRSTGAVINPVEEVLRPYFSLCSYEVNITQAAYLPMVLANGGLAPNGKRIISEETSNNVVSIMATCGMYDESGRFLLNTGLPAKSGVSGLIVAVATGRGGIAVCSPRLNEKGGSVSGHVALEHISNALHWNFAAPWGYARLDNNLHDDY